MKALTDMSLTYAKLGRPTVASIQTSDLLQFSGNSMWRKKLFLFVTCFESKNIPNGMPGTLFSNRWVSIVEMIFKRMWSL